MLFLSIYQCLRRHTTESSLLLPTANHNLVVALDIDNLQSKIILNNNPLQHSVRALFHRIVET